MKKLYFLDEEEKQRILNIHESATKRQYLGEQPDQKFDTQYNKELMRKYQNTGANPSSKTTPKDAPKNVSTTNDNKKFTPAATACIKQFGEPKPAKTPGFVQVDTDKATVFFSTDYEARYRPTGGKIINGQWSCKGNVFNVNLTDGSTWSKAQGGWKTSANKAAEDKTKKAQQYKQQIITKTSDTTKQIQKLLGLPETGNMDTGLLQKINDKLNGGEKASTPASSTPASSTPASSTPASSTQAYNFNVDPNIGKGGINFNQMTPEQIAQGVQSATPPQEPIAATTPPTNKEKRQERRDLRAANRAEMQALRDKQRGNQ